MTVIVIHKKRAFLDTFDSWLFAFRHENAGCEDQEQEAFDNLCARIKGNMKVNKFHVLTKSYFNFNVRPEKETIIKQYFNESPLNFDITEN